MGTANYQTNQLHNYNLRFYSNTQMMYYIVNKIISLEPNTRLLYLPEQVAEKLYSWFTHNHVLLTYHFNFVFNFEVVFVVNLKAQLLKITQTIPNIFGYYCQPFIGCYFHHTVVTITSRRLLPGQKIF